MRFGPTVFNTSIWFTICGAPTAATTFWSLLVSLIEATFGNRAAVGLVAFFRTPRVPPPSRFLSVKLARPAAARPPGLPFGSLKDVDKLSSPCTAKSPSATKPAELPIAVLLMPDLSMAAWSAPFSPCPRKAGTAESSKRRLMKSPSDMNGPRSRTSLTTSAANLSISASLNSRWSFQTPAAVVVGLKERAKRVSTVPLAGEPSGRVCPRMPASTVFQACLEVELTLKPPS